MQEPPTWRELLGKIISDTQERQRIANVLGVSPITLTRWVNKESNPRPQNLRQLLNALPRYRQILLELLGEEFVEFSPKATDNLGEDFSQEIPSAFYNRVLHTRATIPSALRFSSICDLVLQQALEQLDPYRSGLAIIVARCMPLSSEDKVRSLRESVGRGTPPWEINLEAQAIFLGAESLAGYAVISSRVVVEQNLKEGQSLFPAYRGVGEESAAAAPITVEGNIAGSLLISSTQPNYFLPSRLALISSYADLIGLAFGPEEFYEPQQIELRPVPPQQKQQAYLSGFRQRLTDTMLQAARNQHPINVLEAEQLVWQQIEEELLQLAPHIEQ